MEGDGAFTAVDGEKAVMRPFDPVLALETSMTIRPWAALARWIVSRPSSHFNASFSERLGTDQRRNRPVGVRPADTGRKIFVRCEAAADRRPRIQPLCYHPYAEWRASLDGWLQPAHPIRFWACLGSPTHCRWGVDHADHLRASAYPAGLRNPWPSFDRRQHLYVVVEDPGRATDDEPLTLGRATSSLSVVDHITFQADSTLVLFGYSDRACQEKLNTLQGKKPRDLCSRHRVLATTDRRQLPIRKAVLYRPEHTARARNGRIAEAAFFSPAGLKRSSGWQHHRLSAGFGLSAQIELVIAISKGQPGDPDEPGAGPRVWLCHWSGYDVQFISRAGRPGTAQARTSSKPLGRSIPLRASMKPGSHRWPSTV
jgi:hypothetical protein